MHIIIVKEWQEKMDKNKAKNEQVLYFVQKLFPNLIIKKNGNGKPVLIKNAGGINWSHNEVYLVITIVEKGDVGVDIEQENLVYVDAYYEWVLHEEEKRKIEEGVTFAEVWTKKEAILKYTGEGLRDDMKSLNVFEECEEQFTTFLFNENRITVYTKEKNGETDIVII